MNHSHTELAALADEFKGRADDCGRLARAVLAALESPERVQGEASDDLRARCAEIIEWQNTGVLKGAKLREYAAKKPWADDVHVLMIAERETAREAFKVLATPPTAPAQAPQAATAGAEGDNP